MNDLSEKGGRSSATIESREQSKTVEELDGGTGRGVFFRPQRYKPAELGNVSLTIDVATAIGREHRCKLHDVSQNGIAFEWEDDSPPSVGTMLPQLTVTVDEYMAYRGEVRVGSVRPVQGATIVGASFVDYLMNIDDVIHLRDVKAWGADGPTGPSLASQPWKTTGHLTFKSLVGEFRLYLENAAVELAKLEKVLPWHVVYGSDSPARAALTDRIRAEFVPEFVTYTTLLDDALREASGDDWEKLKEYSLGHLQELLLQAPVAHRARTKPRGYPGDYELMRYVYDQALEGPNLFGKAVHLAVVSTNAGLSILGRRDFVKKRILDAARARGDGTLKIASVASGPAQDLFELLNDSGEFPVLLDVVLFDQDKEALTLAHRRLSPLVDRRDSRVQIHYLHDSIKRLIHDPAIFKEFGPFDLIFCTGLFDYLRDKTAITLTRNFYGALTSGGTAHIANVVPENPTRWLMECHLDWFLVHRTREDSLRFAATGCPDAALEIQEEATGVTPFVVITRP